MLEGHVERGHSIIREMHAAGCPADVKTYGKLIHRYATLGERQRACEVFDEMRGAGVPANEFAWTHILQAHLRAHDTEAALQVFADMKKEGIAPDHVSFTVIMQALLRAGETAAMFDMFKEMEDLNVHTDVRMINVLLNDMVKHRAKFSMQHVERVLAEMHKARLQPDKFTCNTLLKFLSYGSGDCYCEASQLVDFMERSEVPIDSYTFEEMLRCCCQKPGGRPARPREAEAWLSRFMEALGPGRITGRAEFYLMKIYNEIEGVRPVAELGLGNSFTSDGVPWWEKPVVRVPPNANHTSVIIQNMAYETVRAGPRALQQMFESHSFVSIADVFIPLHHDTRLPKSFAFVRFASGEEAKRAVEQYNGKVVDNWRWKVQICDRQWKGISPSTKPSSTGFQVWKSVH